MTDKEEIKTIIKDLEEKVENIERMKLKELVQLFIEETRLVSLQTMHLEIHLTTFKRIVNRIAIGAVIWAILQITVLILIMKLGNR